MNYRILANKPKSKYQLRRIAIKWILYTISLLLLYALMRSGVFDLWQPFLIIPLAVSVSLYERELSSCVFALFCGLFIDIANRFLFGFSAVWLMAVCLAASLLSRNLIRVNIINFLWINLVAVILEFSMDYLFNIFIWDIPNRDMILEQSILPSAGSTFIISPLIYFIVRLIYNKLSFPTSFVPYLNETDINDEELTSNSLTNR